MCDVKLNHTSPRAIELDDMDRTGKRTSGGVILKSMLPLSENDAYNCVDDTLIEPPSPLDNKGPRLSLVPFLNHENIYQNRDVNSESNLVSLNSLPTHKPRSSKTVFRGHVVKVKTFVNSSKAYISKNSSDVKKIVLSILVVLYAIYFAAALHFRFGDEGSIRLLWVTLVVAACMLYVVIRDNYGDWIHQKIMAPITELISKQWYWLRWVVLAVVLIALILFFIFDIILKRPRNMVSLSGIAAFILGFYIFSHSPSKVRWRPIIGGVSLQFIFALIILKTSWGRSAFQWLGDRVSEFLAHANAGSKFVFGVKYLDHPFAFKVMPIVIFFGTIVSVLYYLQIMQVVIAKIGWLLEKILGTTAGESVNAAGNIFLGQTEAPFLIRPLLPLMTTSELHAVLVGGFATIAGAVMASFIAMGVPANHLLTACIMAAPAALAMSKLSYPEDKASALTEEGVKKMELPPQRNIVEAASDGASGAVQIVAGIVANLIAFIAILHFVNATLKWFGSRVGMEPPHHPELTFQLICSYVLWPVSAVMGVVIDDCRKVAELIGIKIFINEFVAYTELSRIIENTNIFEMYNGTKTRINDDIYLPGINVTLIGGIMQRRSIAISTYALCGFANISSIGIALGGIGSMIPHRKGELSQIAVRAMITGACTSFLTACTAGLMYQGS